MRLLLLLSLFLLGSCYRAPRTIDPQVIPPLHPKEIFRETRMVPPCCFSVTPFNQLSISELETDWGKEMKMGLLFAEDFDLYRAITSFKRALFLNPPPERRLEITYEIALAYYLGKKYLEAIYTIEASELIAVDPCFPAFSDMLLLLYDSYRELCMEEKACHILSLIEKFNEKDFQQLELLQAVKNADLETLQILGECQPEKKYLSEVVSAYHREAKSVKKAEILNMFLPGAGYWYVGQKNTAITAFIVNALFIAAATEFFIHDNVAAGVITLSLETGWYFGGIYGGGLAAKYYNERLYETYASKILSHERNVPCLMLRYSF